MCQIEIYHTDFMRKELKQFQAENPFQFTQEQFDKREKDITSPRKGVENNSEKAK